MTDFVQNRDKEDRIKYLFMEFHCYKLTGCPPDGPKVCAFDDKEATLAVFEDVCTMYKANCKGTGMFQEIDMVVCETQKAYELQHKNDTFNFIHLTTEAPSTLKNPDYHWLPRNWQPIMKNDYEDQIARDD